MSGRYGGRGNGRGQGRGNRGGRQGRGGSDYRQGHGRGRDNYGGRSGGRGGRNNNAGRGGRGRSGPGRGGARAPDLSGIRKVLSNTLLTKISPNFSFYQYPIQFCDRKGNNIESLGRRKDLFNIGIFDVLLPDLTRAEKEDWHRSLYFAGSFVFSSRSIPELEPANLPRTLVDGTETEGDTMIVVGVGHFAAPTELVAPGVADIQAGLDELHFDLRCANCVQAFTAREGLIQHCQETGHAPVYRHAEGQKPIPASIEFFTSYVNMALQRALGERLARWGKEFVDPTNPIRATGRGGNDLGVDIYEAYSCQFGVVRYGSGREAPPGRLALTCDLRAKVIRRTSLLDILVEEVGGNLASLSGINPQQQNRFKRDWVGEVVIYKHDKKCYVVKNLLFDKTPNTLPVSDRGISHTEYFERKGVRLEYPNAPPMVAVIGRRDSTIYLPAELITGNDLDPQIKEQLPLVASFKPDKRNAAIEKLKAFLVPGAQTTRGRRGLLPAIGISLQNERILCSAQVMPIPEMLAAGVRVPQQAAENWAPKLSKAKFNVEGNQVVTLNVVLVYPSTLKRGALGVYRKIRDCVNGFCSYYRFGAEPFKVIETDPASQKHCRSVQQYFSGRVPKNVFVLDFVKPRAALDTAYPVIKQMLTASGHLSSFVNFKTYSHDNPREGRKSDMILQGVSRQILQKAGVRLWWVRVPPSLPLPAVFIGVDVFHAAMVYDPDTQRRKRKASCAAIIVEVIRGNSSSAKVELYSKTYKRDGGNEFELGDALKETVQEALKYLKVQPSSCVVWRDGVSETSFDHSANVEIAGIREGLLGGDAVVGAAKKKTPKVPLAYIICQKRISNKFLSEDGKWGAPSGTLVADLLGFRHQTFYINGRAPPFSTPKPTRYIIVERDEGLKDVPMARLTWGQCHSYPNWTGPIKVPSTCQMAHKLAELAGSFNDCGEAIDAEAFKNTVHFL